MKAHRTDTSSLVFGLLFLVVAFWWLLAQFTGFELSLGLIGWLGAALLIVAGALGIATAIRSSRDRNNDETNMLGE